MVLPSDPSAPSPPFPVVGYRSFVDASPHVLCVQDLDGRWRYLSPAAAAVLGYEPTALVGRSPEEFVHPEDRDAVLSSRTASLHRDDPATVRFRFKRPDGSYVWLEMVKTPIRDADGTVTKIQAVTRDVSAQVELELALERRERELREAQRVSRVGSWSYSVTGESEWSDEMFRLFRRDPSLGPPAPGEVARHLSPSDVAALRSATERALHAGDSYQYDSEILMDDGSSAWVNTRAEVIRDDAGAITGLRGTLHDISERKRVERALAASEARLREAERIAAVGNWDWDVATDRLTWSPMLFQLMARDPRTGEPSVSERPRHYTPESQERLGAAMRDAVEIGQPFVLDIEVVREDGVHRWMTVRGEALRSASGRVERVRGTLQDVTERLEAEAGRRSSEERYRSVVAAMAEGVVVQGAGGVIQSVNAKALEILGLTMDQMLGRTSFDPRWRAVSEDGRPFPGDAHPAMETLRTRRPCAGVVMGLHRPDRTLRWISINTEPLLREDGTLDGVVSSFTDITEKRAKDHALRQQATFADLMVHVLTRFAECTADDADQAIVEALEAVATFTGADHAFITTLQDDQGGWTSSHEWCAPHFTLSASTFDDLPEPNSSETVARILADESAAFEPDDDRPAVGESRAQSSSGAARSQLFVPMKGQGGVRGALVLHCHAAPRQWTNADEVHARILGTAIAGLLERCRSERALRESEEKYRLIAANTEDVIWLYDLDDQRFSYLSPSIEQLTGYDLQTALSMQPGDLMGNGSFRSFADSLLRKIAALERGDPSARVSTHVVETVHRVGTVVPTEIVTTLVQEADGRVRLVQGVTRDISRRQQLEDQLNQAQKMESVGRLAGGVAHDFNNMLGVIIGNAEMANLEVTDRSGPLAHALEQILSAAERSANLTKQLLAFARRQTISPRVLDLNDTISSMLKMLRRLIGEHIELAWHPGSGAWPVKIDPTQVDQILANIAVNARDAITGTGRLVLATRNVSLDERFCQRDADLTPGDYVELTCADTGSGMPADVLARIFEPFYTTKDSGKGTGLGLSTVYGIVRQNAGFIQAESETGRGTTFHIWLPRFGGDPEPVPVIAATPLPSGTATVLVVEDELAILDLATAMLRKLGYRVLSANASTVALSVFDANRDDIDLVVTDVVMPRMSGPELVEALRAKKPSLKLLFMSGYTADVLARTGVEEQGMPLLLKPFSTVDLAMAVHAAIEGYGASGPV